MTGSPLACLALARREFYEIKRAARLRISTPRRPPNTCGGVRCCRVQETRRMHQTAVSVPQATDFPRGRRIVLTAPLTETIDHAGYFIQMSMASLPIWLEGILNRKYPKWRDVEYNDDGTARYMPAGVRVLEASLLRRFPPDDIVCCYPDDLDKFIGPRHARRRGLDAQPARRDVRRRRLHVDLRVVEAADQLALRARSCSRAIKASPYREQFQGDRRRLGRLADHPDQHLRRAERRLRRRRPQRVGGRRWSCSTRRLRGETLPRQVDVQHPHDARRDPLPRQAHHVRRRRDDDRLRPAVPVLRAGSEPADRPAEGQDHGRACAPTCATATSRSRWPPRTCSSGARCTPTRRSTSRTARRCSICTRTIVDTPGRRAARAQPRDDRAGGRRSGADRAALRRCCLDKSPIHLPLLEHAIPKNKALVPLIGLETGSVRDGQADHAEQGRAVPDRRLAERRRSRAARC